MSRILCILVLKSFFVYEKIESKLLMIKIAINDYKRTSIAGIHLILFVNKALQNVDQKLPIL